MKSSKRYQYFVEGQCEQKLVTALKDQKNLIISGKISVFNIIQEVLTPMRLRTLADNTTVILIFDTDKKEAAILEKNINILKGIKKISDIWCVMQVENLEDELVRSTNIREIKELLHCKSNKEFKRDFLAEKNVFGKLQDHGFNLKKLWNSVPDKPFTKYENGGIKIKKVRG